MAIFVVSIRFIPLNCHLYFQLYTKCGQLNSGRFLLLPFRSGPPSGLFLALDYRDSCLGVAEGEDGSLSGAQAPWLCNRGPIFRTILSCHKFPPLYPVRCVYHVGYFLSYPTVVVYYLTGAFPDPTIPRFLSFVNPVPYPPRIPEWLLLW